LLDRSLVSAKRIAGGRVDYPRVWKVKGELLEAAFARFHAQEGTALRHACEAFARREAMWLNSYTLFMALRELNGGRPWVEWSEGVDRETREPLTGVQQGLSDRIAFYVFEQFLFDRQWRSLREHARSKRIRIIGDLPIYVAHDSADVWANRSLFKLDRQGHATEVAGVPPDYFSVTGQLWNNPIYDWEAMERSGYRWWLARIRRTLDQVDVARIDHFRGFEAYWSVPAGETTAINGRWMPGPGARLFAAIAKDLGGDPKSLPLIAEDLGLITAEVTALRKEFGLPGMLVLHFLLLDSDERRYRVEEIEADTALYTGTHDNDTSVGWFDREILPDEGRRHRLESLGMRDRSTVAWQLMEMAWRSSAHLAIAPAQDLLQLDSSARMNVPGIEWPAEPNWQWRLEPDALTPATADRLADLTRRWAR
jgi:4-alpha-glucanotransferase